MGDFRMPSLGADMEAGTLVAWHVKPGESVKRGDVVAEVETDKGIVEVEIWEAGVVETLAVAPGAKVPVGAVLATVRSNGTSFPSGPRPAAAMAVAAPAGPPPTPPPEAHPEEPLAGRVLASPAARQLARERGVDIASVHGTGPHGSVTRDDVDHASLPSPTPARHPSGVVAATPPAATEARQPRPPTSDASGMRRAIAAAMARSKREIPHYYLSADLDAGPAARWLEAENTGRSVDERVLFATVLLKATALALREVPEMNGFFVDGAFLPSSAVHLGVAISIRQGGLIAPAIHDVDRLRLTDLQANLRDLVARARAGRLRSSEMSDATVTVTNLGDQGVESVFGVIYPPQVALVGFGRLAERAWAAGGMVGARPIVTATLSGDHRVSDGHRGAVLLTAVGRLLREPEKL